MQTFVTNNGPNRPSVVTEHVCYGRGSFELMLYSVTCYIHYNASLMSETVYRQKCFGNAKQSVFHSCYSSHVSAYATGRGLQLWNTTRPTTESVERPNKKCWTARNWAEVRSLPTTTPNTFNI